VQHGELACRRDLEDCPMRRSTEGCGSVQVPIPPLHDDAGVIRMLRVSTAASQAVDVGIGLRKTANADRKEQGD
jgi:hypothetical protein